jgi:hypothetical protein
LVHSQRNSHSSSLNFFLLETRDVAQIAFCLFIGNSIVSSIFCKHITLSFHLKCIGHTFHINCTSHTSHIVHINYHWKCTSCLFTLNQNLRLVSRTKQKYNLKKKRLNQQKKER